MIANGNGPAMLREFERECESLLKPLQKTIMILKANPIFRAVLDFAMTNITN